MTARSAGNRVRSDSVSSAAPRPGWRRRLSRRQMASPLAAQRAPRRRDRDRAGPARPADGDFQGHGDGADRRQGNRLWQRDRERFPDFIEKAETKAIGRALNALGYGAQFGDFQRPDDLGPSAVRSDLVGRRRPPHGRWRCRGEMSDPRSFRARERERRRDTRSRPHRQAVADQELVDYSWSAFWPWARERGLNGPREIENLIGQQVAGLSPAELRDLILAADSRR